MRRIAHLSDLHFGRIGPRIVDVLAADLEGCAPDLVIISGDLTQRARTRQFAAARAFLDRLSAPCMVVPGNHDVAPIFRPMSRAFRPFARYRRYVTQDMAPTFIDGEIAVAGVTTARSYRWSEGSVSLRQIEGVRQFMDGLDDRLLKIVFTHHPFLPPPDSPDTALVRHARSTLPVFESVGVNLLLAGHLHRGFTGDVTHHHTAIKRSILVAQASTATSTRLRAEPNAYNFIRWDAPHLRLSSRIWDGDAFQQAEVETFTQDGHRWHRASRDAMPG